MSATKRETKMQKRLRIFGREYRKLQELIEKYPNYPKKTAILASGGETTVYDYIAIELAEVLLGLGCEVSFVYEGFRGATRGKARGGIEEITNLKLDEMKIESGGKIIKGCRGYNSFNFRGKDYSDITADNLKEFDVIFVIGGDGSMAHASEYVEKYQNKVKFIGLIGTMDGAAATNVTHGRISTNKAILAEIKASAASAESLSRYSVVECMGRFCGEPAAEAAKLYIQEGGKVAAVLTPQAQYDINKVAQAVKENMGMVIVSEGIDMKNNTFLDEKQGYHKQISGAANYIAKELKKILDIPANRIDELSVIDVKGTVTGYTQRAGSIEYDDILNADYHIFQAVKFAITGRVNVVIVEGANSYAIPINTFVSLNQKAEKTLEIKYHPEMRRVLKELRDVHGVYVGDFK